MTIFFTADEHYGHTNKVGGIIKFCNRPFDNITDHDRTTISNHNEVVGPNDTVIHGGDFSWKSVNRTIEIIEQLNGKHIMLKGSHDKAITKIARRQPDLFEYAGYMYELVVHNKYHVTVCHYCMRTWPKSHYNSWHCFAHSHGRLEAIGKQHDIGVDNNNYYPISFEQLKEIMEARPDNPNLVRDKRKPR